MQQLFDNFEKANGDLAAVMQLVMNKENYLELEKKQILSVIRKENMLLWQNAVKGEMTSQEILKNYNHD